MSVLSKIYHPFAGNLAVASLALAAVLSVSLGASPVTAQPTRCAPHEEVERHLAERFAEQPVGIGVTLQGALMEVFAGPEGTWTVVISNPNGITCMVAAGEGWRTLTPEEPDDPLAARASAIAPKG